MDASLVLENLFSRSKFPPITKCLAIVVLFQIVYNKKLYRGSNGTSNGSSNMKSISSMKLQK